MTTDARQKQMDDPDVHKARSKATARPTNRTSSRNGTGVDENGMPNDPVATAQDKKAPTRTSRRGEESAIGELANW